MTDALPVLGPRPRGRPAGVSSATRCGRFKASIAELEPLAVGADEAAALVGIGKTLWHELDSAGKIPAPVRLGSRCVWVVSDLRAWVAAGCPDRERWDVIRTNPDWSPKSSRDMGGHR